MIVENKLYFKKNIYFNTILLDGSNLAYLEFTKEIPSAKNLEIIIQKIQKEYPNKKIICIVDASFKYKIKDDDLLEEMLKNKKIKIAPAGVAADIFMLKYLLKNQKSILISNDLFRDYPEFKEIIKNRKFSAMVIDGDLILNIY